MLRLASWNIHKCVGADRRFDPDRTAAVIAELDADIVALQEVDTRFGERRGLLDLRAIERSTGLSPVPLPERRRAHGWHGNMILVRTGRHPFAASDPGPETPGPVRRVHPVDLPGLEPRGALIAELTVNGSHLRVIGAHLGLVRTSRRQQVRNLLGFLAAAEDMPTVLMGDLNEWRLGKPSGLADLAETFGNDAGVPSFPARLPLLALDRIMANRQGMVSGLAVHASALARIASDHLPVTAMLSLGEAG